MSNEDQVQETTEGTEEETVTVLEVNTDTSINAPLDEVDDPETLKKMVKKLRGENAKARTRNKEEQAELDQFKAWKESQMTELEKLQARLQEAEAKASSAVRNAILVKHSVPEELQEFVTGTEEEMEAKAAKLAGKFSSTSDGGNGLVPDLFRSAGGKPVKPKADDDGGAFLQMLAREGRIN